MSTIALITGGFDPLHSGHLALIKSAREMSPILAIGLNSDDCIVVASYGTFSLGVNVKRIHNIVFASPYKSQIKVLQSIGRGLRTADDKEVLKLFDIADNLVYNNRENYTLKHFRERINIYNEQGFEYQIVPVTLK